MKKILFVLALITAMAGQAQIMKVSSVEPLNVNQDKNQVVQAVAISPQGDYLLLSTDTKQGLVKWDFASGTASTVTTDPGAGSDVRITGDGQQIVYNEVSYKGKRRHQAVKALDLATGNACTSLEPPARLCHRRQHRCDRHRWQDEATRYQERSD